MSDNKKFELAVEFAGHVATTEVYRIAVGWYVGGGIIAHNDHDLDLLVEAGIVREVGEKTPRRMQASPCATHCYHDKVHDEVPGCLDHKCIPVEPAQEKPAAKVNLPPVCPTCMKPHKPGECEIYTDAQGVKYEKLEIVAGGRKEP